MRMATTRASAHGTISPRNRRRSVLRERLGDIDLHTLAVWRAHRLRDVTVSLHPAGHVLGSAQVRIEHRGEVWVASGDYKLDADPTCDAVRAGALRHVHHRIDVRPADLPLARSAQRDRRHRRLVAAQCRRGARQRAVLLRVRQGAAHPRRARDARALDAGPLVFHGAVEPLNRAYRAAGVMLPPGRRVTEVDKACAAARARARAAVGGRLAVDAPLRRLQRRLRVRLDAAARRAPAPRRRPRLRAVRPRRLARAQRGDRRDRAHRVIVTHGQVPVMVRWLVEHGLARAGVRNRVRRRRRERCAACAWERRRSSRRERRRGSDRRRSARRRDHRSIAMEAFARLYAELDATTSTHAKLAALERYFAARPPPTPRGRRISSPAASRARSVPARRAARRGSRGGRIAAWLFDECYQAVGDFAETVAHVLPPPSRTSRRRPGRMDDRARAAAARRRRPRRSPSACAATGTSSMRPAASCCSS